MSDDEIAEVAKGIAANQNEGTGKNLDKRN